MVKINSNYTYVNFVSVIAMGLMLLMLWLVRWTYFSEDARKYMFWFLGFLFLGHLVVTMLGIFATPAEINDKVL
jgi:hypothetical protein